MRLLLDTHTFLWFANDDSRLSASAKAMIQDPSNQRWLSIASPWEMAIKLSIKKLTLTSPLQQFMAKHLPLNMVQLLPIPIDHLATVAALPLHHRDPFDRLLVAQAIVDDFDVISADSTLDAYSIRHHW